WPGEASPRMDAEGEPLKRSSLGEPRVQPALAKAEKGTMPPWELRTYQRFTSSGSMRKGASPCMKTFFTRPLSMKSFTYVEPQTVLREALMSASERPRALAFS